MSTGLLLRQDLDWSGRHLLDGSAAARGARLREALHRGLWGPAVHHWCAPFTVTGTPLTTPAVYVANHASHADTAAIRAAIGRSLRARLAVAAADDYFFSSSRRAAGFTVAVGAFPFPRNGDLGLRRANALLTEGWSVLLYPQGTRNAGSEYRPGALRLVREGWPIVPVGIAGTDRVLPKGARRPRRAATAVVFGAPLEPASLLGADALRAFADAIRAVEARAKGLAAR